MLTNMQIPGLALNPGGAGAQAGPATQVLCLMNMVNVDELVNDDDYEGTPSLFLVFVPLVGYAQLGSALCSPSGVRRACAWSWFPF